MHLNIESGHGVYLVSSEGTEYIDCASGTFNLPLGYCHPEIVEIYKSQAAKLIHCSSSFKVKVVEELEIRLASLAPMSNARVMLKSCSGSVANEGAAKIAQHATNSRDFISFFRAHHGQTVFSTALSGNSFRLEPFQMPSSPIVKVPAPTCSNCFYGKTESTCQSECVTKIDDFIEFSSSGSIAGIFVEPVMGNGDNIVWPKKALFELRKFASERNIPLIFDEVQTGIGRTGSLFAADLYETSPDIMTLAKGLGGSGAQIAAIVVSEEFATMPPSLHAFTTGGNIVGIAAALKTLEIVTREGFLENVREMGDRMTNGLKQIFAGKDYIKDIRGPGLMIGIEIVDEEGNPSPERVSCLVNEGYKNRLILRESRYGRGPVLKMRPPLIINKEEVDRILARLSDTVDAAEKHVRWSNIDVVC